MQDIKCILSLRNKREKKRGEKTTDTEHERDRFLKKERKIQTAWNRERK